MLEWCVIQIVICKYTPGIVKISFKGKTETETFSDLKRSVIPKAWNLSTAQPHTFTVQSKCYVELTHVCSVGSALLWRYHKALLRPHKWHRADMGSCISPVALLPTSLPFADSLTGTGAVLSREMVGRRAEQGGRKAFLWAWWGGGPNRVRQLFQIQIPIFGPLHTHRTCTC